MRSHAAVVAETRAGAPVYPTLRSDPPLLLRPVADELNLVGGAAGPLGGDDLQLDVTVDACSTVKIRSVAASMALPGQGPSELRVNAVLGDDARLDWSPQPLISVASSNHRQVVHVSMTETATLRWVDHVVLGRHEEDPGCLNTMMRVERAGRVVFHQQIRLGDDASKWQSPAVLAGVTSLRSELIIGPDAIQPSSAPDETLYRIADDVVQIVCLHT